MEAGQGVRAGGGTSAVSKPTAMVSIASSPGTISRMRTCRIEQVGTPDEVFHQPANEFVLNFLGHVNVFHGRIQADRAVFGPLAVKVPNAGAAEGSQARLFVRPYDLEVHSLPTGADSLRATVTRVQSAGPAVRLELRTPDGQLVQVEISHEQSRRLDVQQDDVVYVRPRQSRVYVYDHQA